MSKRDKLKMAQEARNRVPLGDWRGFAAAQDFVRMCYEDLARS